MAEQDNQTAATKQLVLQKIYIKDLSFESPKSPEVFTSNASAQTQLNIRSSNRDLGNDQIEVMLTLTVDSKNNDETLFLIEVVQAGVFLVQGYTGQERSAVLGSFCPGTLYPFAREAIADIATKGGFPPLLLQPINFDALYAQASRDGASQPGASQPGASQPGASQPGTSQPGTSQPGTSQPGAAAAQPAGGDPPNGGAH